MIHKPRSVQPKVRGDRPAPHRPARPKSRQTKALAATPKVSVVMTTFNAERHLEEALQSIRGQTFFDYEFIIVDDSSTDRTPAILGAAAANDRRIRVATVQRAGRIRSLNLAVQLARARFIANMDADDVALPDRLQMEYDFLLENPNVALVGAGTILRIDQDGRELPPKERPTDHKDLVWCLGRFPPFFHSSTMYRRSAWARVGGFDETLPCYEDYDFWVRLAAQHQLANLPAALGKKRRHVAQRFGRLHYTATGYRARSRILRRYVRHVRPDPRVLVRSLHYMYMNQPILRVKHRFTGKRDDPAYRAGWGLDGAAAPLPDGHPHP